jgi:hypothetical protein
LFSKKSEVNTLIKGSAWTLVKIGEHCANKYVAERSKFKKAQEEAAKEIVAVHDKSEHSADYKDKKVISITKVLKQAQSRMTANLQYEEANEKRALAGKRAEIERKNNASRAKQIACEQAVRLQLQQKQVAVAENEARELAGRAGGGNRGESDCGADAAAVEAGAEAGVETGAAEAAGTEAASADQMDAISQLELLLGGS